MTEKIRLEIDDATATGLDSVEKNLKEVGNEAATTEKKLNQAATAAKKLGDGGKDTKKMSLQLTELNQGLELIKKGFELGARAVTSLAESGNPAAQSLVDSFGKLGETMQALGDNKNVSDLMGGLASTITDRVIPAISAVPGWFEKTSQSLAQIGTQAAEFTGFFPEGTTEALAEDQVRLTEIAEAQRKINEEARITYQITGKSEEIAARAAADMELRNLARLESERTLNDYLELEIENRQELSDKGELSGKKLAESDRRLEVIQRRLAEIPQVRADAESKAANEIAQAKIKATEEENQKKIDAEKEWQDAIKKGEEEQGRLNKERLDKATAEANMAADRLLKAIEQAKGPKGGNLLDEARAAISPEQTRAQLVKQAKEDARKKFIEENRGKVDLEGKASGGTRAEQRQNQRKVDREIELAEREAGTKAFRGFNAGKVDQSQIANAQNSLINTAAQAAVGRGDLDQTTANALQQAAQNQQSLIQTQQQQQQQLNQVMAMLTSAGNASRNTYANGRRQMFTR